MNGAREYSKLFKTGQYGRFYIVSGSHARGKTFHIYVLPEGETAISNGQHNGPLNKDAVEVYGITGGQPGWTEAYGWFKEGLWIEEFNDLLGSMTGIRPPSVEAKSRGIMTKCDGNHALTTLCTDNQCWQGDENPIVRLREIEVAYKEMIGLQREHGDQWLNYLISTYITENDLLSDVCKDLTTVRDQQAERLKDSLFRLIDLQNENAALRQNAELAKRTRGFSVGDAVMVYDRYRFAIPLKATIRQFSDTNDGVKVMLFESNSAQYPIGADNVWVHQSQIRHAE